MLNPITSRPLMAVPAHRHPTVGLELFIEGDALYLQMLADLALAQRRIRIESYIFADDEVGTEFLDLLRDKAEQGVRVELRVDAFGSRGLISRSRVRDLRRAGVRFRWSRAWRWLTPFAFNRRNHRKLLVVDGRVAYTGGFNIHRESSRRAVGEGRWRDVHVRVDGETASLMAQCFDAYTRGQVGWRGTSRSDRELLTNHSMRCRNLLRCRLLERFRAAREQIWITTPYFVPDSGLLRSLASASERGVDVRLLLPRNDDTRIARWAARALYARLLTAGVRIFEYAPRLIHAKVTVVDGAWASIGTANMDYRSLFINDEVNLIAQDDALSAALKTLFLADTQDAREVRLDSWRVRPWEQRLAEMFGFLLRRWL
jgi:cardiolipin synthase A/B